MSLDSKKPPALTVTCYGAGSEVGRSCILVELTGHHILFDCGVNIGTSNPHERLPRLPDPLPPIDLILISHIHSDHIASRPWLTEVLHCPAPVYMTSASAMLSRIMLEDFI
jgi:Cft2 family RNA processing exonuclease